LNLYRFVNERALETKSAASYIRSTLATALRKNPYQVNLLLGGVEKETGEASLYFIDYLSSMQKVNFGAHGYGGYFSLSIMDKYYHDNLTLEEGKDIMRKCIAEVQKRLLLNSPAFIYKVITKNGVEVIEL
jgi:20S proteasome subunit beta 4